LKNNDEFGRYFPGKTAGPVDSGNNAGGGEMVEKNLPVKKMYPPLLTVGLKRIFYEGSVMKHEK